MRQRVRQSRRLEPPDAPDAPDVPCLECDGTGYDEDAGPCRFCDGSGVAG